MKDISSELLSELLQYDPLTGLLTWKSRDVSMFDTYGHSNEHSCKIWNSNYAGKQAGSLSHGYFAICILKQRFLAHRIIFKMMTGRFPNSCVDHIDGNRSNNKWGNLREATHSENNKNHPKRSDNKSGFKGVSWSVRKQKWVAQIKLSGKAKFLGYFKNAKDGHDAYMRAAAQHHGQFARAA